MECGNCGNRFTRNWFTPLILPRCGHTICKPCFENCCKDEIICAICQYVKTSNERELPTNQALLEILPEKAECKRHKKVYQAFCVDDKKFLCMDCVIEQQCSNHNVLQISEASFIFKQGLTEELIKSQKQIGYLDRQVNIVYKKLEMCQKDFNQKLHEITSIFSKARSKLGEIENNLKNQLNQEFNEAKQQFDARILQYNDMKKQLIDMQDKVRGQIDDIAVIQCGIKLEKFKKMLSSKQRLQAAIDLAQYDKRKILLKIQQAVRDLQNFDFIQKDFQPQTTHAKISDIQIPKQSQTPKKPIKPQIFSSINKSMLQIDISSIQHDMSQISDISYFDFNTDLAKFQIIGGQSSCSTQISEIYENSQWHIHPWDIDNRINFTLTNYGQSLLAIGGQIDQMKTDTILKLQPNSYKHSKIKLLNPVSGHASLCVDSDLVIIGGCNISALNKVEIFKDNRWSLLPSMIHRRNLLQAILYEQHTIFSIGGEGGQEFQSQRSIEKLDVRTKKWETCKNMDNIRKGHQALCQDHYIYIVGGWDNFNAQLSCELYDLRMNQIVPFMHLNNPRASFSLGYFNQQLYAIGGYNHSGLTTVEKYSIKDNHWEEIASLNYSRHGHCVISLNN